MAGAEIQLEGLAKFRKGIKQIDPQLQKDFRNEILPIARKVADDAASRVPSRSGRAKGSIKAGVSGNNAYVQGGRSTVPYYGWLDFGSRNAHADGNRTTGPWKNSGVGPARGRFIYPAIDQHRDDIEREAAKAIDDIIDKALPK